MSHIIGEPPCHIQTTSVTEANAPHSCLTLAAYRTQTLCPPIKWKHHPLRRVRNVRLFGNIPPRYASRCGFADRQQSTRTQYRKPYTTIESAKKLNKARAAG